MTRYGALIFLFAFGFHVMQPVRAEETQTSKPANRSTGLIGSMFGTEQRGIQAFGGAGNKASNQTRNSTTSSTTSEPENSEESTATPPLNPDIIEDIGNLTNDLSNDGKDSSNGTLANPLNLFDDIRNLTTTALNRPLDLPKQAEDNVAKLVKSRDDVAKAALGFMSNTRDSIFKVFNDTLKPLAEQLPQAFAPAQDIISKVLNAQVLNTSVLVAVSLMFRQVLDMIAKMYNSYMLPLTKSYARAREVLKFFHLM